MNRDKFLLAQAALDYHSKPIAGKLRTQASKPMFTQEDLSLAYSPGVAEPVRQIAKDQEKIYEYTSRGNMVAVISNGTAILGLGNLGAAAAKPVMEGKAVLFKKFADIDSFDLEINTENPDEFINCVKYLGYSFGGINLEDIKAPECFYIEEKLKELLDIPVFHDDQHGTAIITAAGLINAAQIVGKNLPDLKIVVNGAGAAAIACLELLTAMGLKQENIILCDTKGVIYKGRTQGMNQWKEKYASNTQLRTLAQVMQGADVFIGLSVKGAVSREMITSMAPKPIIFALANPDPEITPEEVKKARNDAIIATGRSDYPNQINNLMGFPYIFRGALDIRAKTINLEMKIAAAEALAQLAKQLVPTEVSQANANRKMEFGPEYIVPSPFDPRLITTIPIAVAKAAISSGVARITNIDLGAYKTDLLARVNPTANYINLICQKAIGSKKIIFAEGEDPETIKAALHLKESLGSIPILVGREHKIKAILDDLGQSLDGMEIQNAAVTPNLDDYITLTYQKLQRKGYLYRDCSKMVKTDKNIFAACLLESGLGDSLVTGNTKNYSNSFADISKIISTKPPGAIFSYYMLIKQTRHLMIIDPKDGNSCAEKLAYIAKQAAQITSALNIPAKVAFISHANFTECNYAATILKTIQILDQEKVSFEYDGAMLPDVALDHSSISLYTFCKLSGPANILIMPNTETTLISLALLNKSSSSSYMIGPILSGFTKSIQIVQTGVNASEIINLATISLANELV